MAELSELLVDCVQGGAPVGFMLPISLARADAFWREVAESAARDAGRTLLVLDTVTGSDAGRLYSRAGWRRSGDIPGYALWPDGTPCSTTVYFKTLGD